VKKKNETKKNTKNQRKKGQFFQSFSNRGEVRQFFSLLLFLFFSSSFSGGSWDGKMKIFSSLVYDGFREECTAIFTSRPIPFFYPDYFFLRPIEKKIKSKKKMREKKKQKKKFFPSTSKKKRNKKKKRKLKSSVVFFL
jgi:hypothetical protein